MRQVTLIGSIGVPIFTGTVPATASIVCLFADLFEAPAVREDAKVQLRFAIEAAQYRDPHNAFAALADAAETCGMSLRPAIPADGPPRPGISHTIGG